MAVGVSQNPMLKNALKATGGDEGGMSVQYADVIVKTGLLFFIAVISAGVAWATVPPDISSLVMFGSMIAALVVALVASFRKAKGPALPLLYAVLEGVAVGLLSEMFAAGYGADIVVTAVVATAVVFAVCLGIFMIPAVRNGSQGRKLFLVVLVSYLLFSVISLLLGLVFGLGDGLGIYGMGWLGIAIAFGATLLSAWSLVVDFGSVDSAVRGGYPQPYSWVLSMGLFISTVWLYLNILRLLAMARR